MDETNDSIDTTTGRDELKPATLDQLYKEQVSELRNSILKSAEVSDIEVCRKWLNVFNRSSNSEKMDRNCLCILMQQQLNEHGRLCSPFTNLNNCKRNLKSVLRELDDASCTSNRSLNTESADTFNSHHIKCMPDDRHIISEMAELNIESIELKRELDKLRLHLTEQQIENAKLKEIVENYSNEAEGNKQFLDTIKADILNSIRDKLLQLNEKCYTGAVFNINIFQSIFQVHSNDKEFMDIIEKFDIDFEHILKRYVELDASKRKATLTRQILRKFLKKQTKLHEKYERRLTMQAMAQKLQLKLSKLKCFSVLRQIFIRSHSDFGKVDLWEVLKILEDKYQAVVNDI